MGILAVLHIWVRRILAKICSQLTMTDLSWSWKKFESWNLKSGGAADWALSLRGFSDFDLQLTGVTDCTLAGAWVRIIKQMRLWDGFWWQDWTLNWVIWPGSDIHWAIADGWVCWSGSLGGWGQRLHSSAGRSYGFGCMMVHGCKLISTAGQGYNSVSMISWGYRPCFLVSFISGSTLYSYRDWTLRLVELLYTLWSGRLELIGLIPFQAKAYNRVCSLARILARDSKRAKLSTVLPTLLEWLVQLSVN